MREYKAKLNQGGPNVTAMPRTSTPRCISDAVTTKAAIHSPLESILIVLPGLFAAVIPFASGAGDASESTDVDTIVGRSLELGDSKPWRSIKFLVTKKYDEVSKIKGSNQGSGNEKESQKPKIL